MKKLLPMHSVVLACILIGGIATFYFVRANSFLQLLVGIVTSVSYILWGIIYHAVQRDLHRKVVVEYILIGSIAIVLLATVLLR